MVSPNCAALSSPTGLAELAAELKRLKKAGCKGKYWRFPELAEHYPVLYTLGLKLGCPQDVKASGFLQAILHTAASRIDSGGPYSRAALKLFGLPEPESESKGASHRPLRVRRKEAADVFYVTPESFAKRYEPEVTSALAYELLVLAC
jgi:hypothetical protein